MARLRREPVARPAATPGGEAVASIGDLIGSYGRSHPSSRERTERLIGWTRSHRRQIVGRRFYMGTANFELRVPFAVEAIESEYVQR